MIVFGDAWPSRTITAGDRRGGKRLAQGVCSLVAWLVALQ